MAPEFEISVPHIVAALLLLIVLLITYYVFLTRAILGMLRLQASPVLLVFAFLALIPLPPVLLLGGHHSRNLALSKKDLRVPLA